MTYEIRQNTQYNSLEVYFDGKPSEEVRDVLKSHKFRWHSQKRCWYGYKDEGTVRTAIDGAEGGKTTAKAEQKTKANKYGVKVGDLFYTSWGYEQTNVDFFQVIELVGESSVRVREVYPQMTNESPTCSMAADRTYAITNEILPAASSSVFIRDQEKGDLKRIKPGYNSDPAEANKNCFFYLDSFANAYKCTGDSMTTYESWYA